MKKYFQFRLRDILPSLLAGICIALFQRWIYPKLGWYYSYDTPVTNLLMPGLGWFIASAWRNAHGGRFP